MHIFTRKVNEKIIIGDAVVTIFAISPTRVRLTVDAPKGLPVGREETYLKKRSAVKPARGSSEPAQEPRP
jgi:carbon storage regulator CsrA